MYEVNVLDYMNDELQYQYAMWMYTVNSWIHIDPHHVYVRTVGYSRLLSSYRSVIRCVFDDSWDSTTETDASRLFDVTWFQSVLVGRMIEHLCSIGADVEHFTR